MEAIVSVLFVIVVLVIWGAVLWFVVDQGYKRGYRSSFIRTLMTRYGYSRDQAEAAYKEHWARSEQGHD